MSPKHKSSIATKSDIVITKFKARVQVERFNYVTNILMSTVTVVEDYREIEGFEIFVDHHGSSSISTRPHQASS